MCEFKVGDKVRVRYDLKAGKRYGGVVAFSFMLAKRGEVLTVDKVDYKDEAVYAGGYWWSTEMLDIAPYISIEVYNRKTVAKMFECGKVKVAVAKCSPDDEFDFAIGAKLALERLFDKKPTFTKEDLKTGMFGKMTDGDWFMVLDNTIVYQNGKVDFISGMSDDLSYPEYAVEVLVNADCFLDAKRKVREKFDIIWQRK